MFGYISAVVICSENCEFRGADNVQGQIPEYIFSPNRGYDIYYPSNIFRNTRDFLKIREHHLDIPQF